MMAHRFVQDLTSDVMFEADGKDLSELFTHAALAMFELTCQVKHVKQKKSLTLRIKADTLQHLLQDFLNEIIAQADIHSMHFSKIKISQIDDKKVTAKVFGDTADPAYGGTVAKAVSNYNFSVKKIK